MYKIKIGRQFQSNRFFSTNLENSFENHITCFKIIGYLRLSNNIWTTKVYFYHINSTSRLKCFYHNEKVIFTKPSDRSDYRFIWVFFEFVWKLDIFFKSKIWESHRIDTSKFYFYITRFWISFSWFKSTWFHHNSTRSRILKRFEFIPGSTTRTRRVKNNIFKRNSSDSSWVRHKGEIKKLISRKLDVSKNTWKSQILSFLRQGESHFSEREGTLG